MCGPSGWYGLVLLLAIAPSACASQGLGRGSRNLITAEEIGETDATSAFRAIEILRPNWLRSRGPTSVDDPTPTYPNVYLDGSFMGDLEFLRSYHVRDIGEIHFLDPGRAAVRFGMGHPRGVIEIIAARR